MSVGTGTDPSQAVSESACGSERGSKTVTKTCRSHCNECGGHFAGNSAFDRHRTGRFDVPRDHPEARRCADPDTMTNRAGERIFEEYRGECRIVHGEPHTDVVIYRLVGEYTGPKEDA